MEKSDGASFVPGNEGEIFYLTWLKKKKFYAIHGAVHKEECCP